MFGGSRSRGDLQNCVVMKWFHFFHIRGDGLFWTGNKAVGEDITVGSGLLDL